MWLDLVTCKNAARVVRIYHRYRIPKCFRTSWLAETEDVISSCNAVWLLYPRSLLQPKLLGVALYVSPLTSVQDVMAYLHWSRLFTVIVMAIFKYLLTTAAVLSLIASAQCHGTFARSMRKDDLHARQLEASKRYNVANLIKAQKTSNFQQDDVSTSTSGVKNITFSNPLASREFKFYAWHSNSNCDI